MKTQKFALVMAALLGLGGLSPVFAADNSGTINTPNNDAYTAAPGTHASPAPKSSAHKKRAHKATQTKTHTTTPADPVSAQGAPPDTSRTDTVAPGLSGSNMGNDAGKANMGSGDHVPGTTGTSGQ